MKQQTPQNPMTPGEIAILSQMLEYAMNALMPSLCAKRKC
jgi:hypothetical protein